jgi:hypothetical protein
MSQSAQQAEIAEVKRLFRETDAQFKEVAERFKETDTRFKETDEKLRRLEGLFGMQWGRLLEALVAPDALRIFRERGIDVHYIYERAKLKFNGENREFDLLLEDSDQVIVVEIKSRLRIEDVREFEADLLHFTDFFPKYRQYRIYGAVASLDFLEDADRYAYKRGLFVLGFIGDGIVQLLNDGKFRPRIFGLTAAASAHEQEE